MAERVFISMKGMDVAVLLYHLQQAANNPEIGHQDFEHSLASLMKDLKQRLFKIRLDKVESALYAANLMDEAGKFWHPAGKSFDVYIRDILIGAKKTWVYDRFYNYFNNMTQKA